MVVKTPLISNKSLKCLIEMFVRWLRSHISMTTSLGISPIRKLYLTLLGLYQLFVLNDALEDQVRLVLYWVIGDRVWPGYLL